MFGTRSIAIALSALFTLSPLIPAQGFAMPKALVQPVQAGNSPVDLVRCEGPRCRDGRRSESRRHDRNRHHSSRHDRDRRDWRHHREARRSYDRGYRRGYHNGHRGYRYARPGYRYYDGYWFPLAAFATGAIIGGAIATPAPVYSGNAHTQWCYNRYRSYRAYDNTYQPYSGPRRQCISPY